MLTTKVVMPDRSSLLLRRLASVPDWLRYTAVAGGSVVFMVTRRSIFAGVASGEILMLAGKWWLGLPRRARERFELQPARIPVLSRQAPLGEAA
jgi:hypothetical protein